MKLEELLKKCTPTPLLVVVGKDYCFHDTTRVAIVKVRQPSKDNPEGSEETVAEVWPGENDCDIYDAHRFVHAVNLLPELVEALKGTAACLLHAKDRTPGMHDTYQEAEHKARAILCRANNIELKGEAK